MIDPATLLLQHGDQPAIVYKNRKVSYSGLFGLVQQHLRWLEAEQIKNGSVVAVKGDFSPQSVSLLLALFKRNCVAVLLPSGRADADALCTQVGAESLIDTAKPTLVHVKQHDIESRHPLLSGLLAEQKAGFVIFSSGSSGRPKPILHSLDRFLAKYKDRGKPFVTLSFLLLDHIAGIDTLFYILFSGGTLVAPQERGPNAICNLIEQAQVEVLPVSPSFLNLLWLSRDFEQFDLSSVKIVTFGSEPMTAGNLANVKAMFPQAILKQKYGTSEFGSPASKSRRDDQRWIQLSGSQFETRVVSGILHVKAETTMLGYLDDSEPMFTEDGWYNTGDRVEVDGVWLKILGRESDMINVGGEKVFPSEVEAVIQTVDGVVECAVYGEANPITGNMVCAKIFSAAGVDQKMLKKKVKKACRNSLSRYKVPVKITFSRQSLISERQKTIRNGDN